MSKTIEQLQGELEEAQMGGNSGDVVSAAFALADHCTEQRIASLEARLREVERDAAKWRAICIDWTEDEENGVYTWQGYMISQWTGEAWGPDGFRHDSGDCMEAKAACLEHFKRHGVAA